MLRRYDTLIIDEAHERSLNIDFILGYLKPAAAAAARPEGDRHLGDDRHRALRRALRRRAPIIEVDGAHVPGRGALPPVRRRGRRPTTIATRCRRSATPSTSWPPRGRATCSCSSSGEREIHDTADALRRLDLPRHRGAAAVRPAVGGRAAPHLPAAPRPAHRARRPTSPRRRSPCPACATWSTPARRGSPATASGSRCSDCRSSRCRRRRPTSAPGAAAASRPASASASTTRTTSPLGPSSPSRRSCARTSPSVILQMTDDRPRRRRRVPVPRAARPAARSATAYLLLEELGALDAGRARRSAAADPARPPAGPPADRPAARADGARGRATRLRARGAGDRRRAVDPGPARAPGGAAARRPTRCTAASPSTGSRPPRRSSRCGTTCASSSGRCRATSSAGCAAPSTSTTCACASGRTCTASCARSPASSASGPATTTAHPDRVHQVAARRAAVAPRHARRARRREFRGARGSTLRDRAAARCSPRRPPKWVMAAELVETNRLWARTRRQRSSRSGPSRLGAAPRQALVRRAAVGRARRAAAVTTEPVTLYGLPIVTDRTIGYDRVDPAAAREPVHPHALVERRVDARTTSSSPTTPRSCERVAARGDRVRRGATWSTTRCCSTSTTSGSPPT